MPSLAVSKIGWPGEGVRCLYKEKYEVDGNVLKSTPVASRFHVTQVPE